MWHEPSVTICLRNQSFGLGVREAFLLFCLGKRRVWDRLVEDSRVAVDLSIQVEIARVSFELSSGSYHRIKHTLSITMRQHFFTAQLVLVVQAVWLSTMLSLFRQSSTASSTVYSAQSDMSTLTIPETSPYLIVRDLKRQL